MLKSKLKLSKLSKPTRLQRTNSTPKPSGWRRALQAALVLVALGCVFVIFSQLAPSKKTLTTNQQEVFTAAVGKKEDVNTLIIPKIAVSSPILEGDAAVLDKGTWHRFPDRGNPEKGGNFILYDEDNLDCIVEKIDRHMDLDLLQS